jgi:hypothetical protein
MATRWGAILQSAFVALLLFGTGCQTVIEDKPYRIVTPTGKNYYRVKIKSNSYTGKAEYSARAFPTWAVDAYLGRETSPPKRPDQEARMRDKMHESMAQLYEKYADAVKRLNFDEAARDAQGLLALQGVPLAHEAQNSFFLNLTPLKHDPNDLNYLDTVRLTEVEFNIVRNLADFTWGKKHVIALSNDPDAILDSIAAIGEEPRTTNAVTGAMLAMMGLTASDQFVRANQESQAAQAAGKQIGSLGTDAEAERIGSAEDVKAKIVQVKSLLETLP